MRTLLPATVAVALLCGCGGGSVLDSRFNGNWLGQLTVVVGTSSQALSKTIGLKTTGDAVTLGGDCGLHGIGADRTFEIIATQACSSPTSSCPSAQFLFESGDGTLSENGGTLVLSFGGHVQACGFSSSFLWTFTGKK